MRELSNLKVIKRIVIFRDMKREKMNGIRARMVNKREIVVDTGTCVIVSKKEQVVVVCCVMMQGKRTAAEFEFAVVALCTDEYTKEVAMIERFLVVRRNARVVLEGAEDRKGEDAVRFFKSKFAEGVEQLLGGAKEEYMRKVTRTSRCNHFERGCSQLVTTVCSLVLGEGGGSPRRGGRLFVRGVTLFAEEVARIRVLEEWLPMWEKMLPVMTVTMIRACLFFSYEEYRNQFLLVLQEEKLNDRQMAELPESKQSVDMGRRVVRKFVEKKMKDYAGLGDEELNEERRAESMKVLEKSERLVRLLHEIVPMYYFVDKENGTDEKVRTRWKKELFVDEYGAHGKGIRDLGDLQEKKRKFWCVGGPGENKENEFRSEEMDGLLHEILVELVEKCGNGAGELLEVAMEEIGCFALEYKKARVNGSSDMEGQNEWRRYGWSEKKGGVMWRSLQTETSIGRLLDEVWCADHELWEKAWEELKGWSGRYNRGFHISGRLEKRIEERIVMGMDMVRVMSRRTWKKLEEAAGVYFLSKL